MSILQKLKKSSRIKETDILTKSILFGKQELVTTPIPMINTALSGSLDGGLTGGLTVIAGPSKNFKTLYSLLMASAYLKKYPEACLLFYDSEFGSPQSYFESLDIDPERVLHVPIKDVEDLKMDLVHQLDSLERGKDRVCIVIDSIGNLASKKELEDTLDAKSVTDMSRAKSIKGLFRMVTPYLTLKDVPCIAINHIYMTQEMYSKPVVSGGTGIYYSANTIWIVGRQQEKEGTEIKGYNFIINVEKSRFVKEKSKIPITVLWEGGIDKASGLLELAIEGGFIVKDGHFVKLVDAKTGEIHETKVRPKKIPTEYWEALVKYQPFYDFVKNKYTITEGSLIHDEEEDEA